jgi:hypothetical protein
MSGRQRQGRRSAGKVEATLVLPTWFHTKWCALGFLGWAKRTHRQQWWVQRRCAVRAGQLQPRRLLVTMATPTPTQELLLCGSREHEMCRRGGTTVSGPCKGILARSPRRWNGQCGLTTTGLATRRGWANEGAQGRAGGTVWQVGVQWWACVSSSKRRWQWWLGPPLGENEREAGVNWRRWRVSWRSWGSHDLTGGPTAGVRMPQRVHMVAMACSRSATESTEEFKFSLRKSTDRACLMP